jgi:hypothetical protein
MRHFERFAPLAVAALVLAITLPRLSSFGIWDPWELESADVARKVLDGAQVNGIPSGARAASLGFAALGVDEWTGRLPLALAGLLAVLAAYGLCAFVADRRAAVYAALIAASSPLFVLNARLMLGAAPSFALQGAIALFALFAVSLRPAQHRRGGALVVTLAAVALSVYVDGALQGALPPLLAVTAAALFDGRLRSRPLETGVLLVAAATLAALTGRAIMLDPAEHNLWLGGAAHGGQPPSYDAAIERLVHAFAPWSALLPLALARFVLAPNEASNADPKSGDARLAGTMMVLWIALGYAAQTLFLSRYGKEAAFLPLVALACAVGLFLRDFERVPGGHWPMAVAGMLLAVLLVRDYALYPIAPVGGLSVADFKAPEGFNPREAWGAVLGLFAGTVLLGLGAPPQAKLGLREPYAFAARSWRRGIGHKVWWIMLALGLLALLAYGAAAWIGPDALKLTTQARKWGKRLSFVPLALPIAIALLQVVLYLFGRLGSQRPWAVIAAGALVGLYAAHGYMPKLSAHFSPRDVYETYNELASKGEPLVEYRVGGRAAAYYAQGDVHEVETLNALLKKLDEPGRVWAVIPSDELAAIDRMFRRKHERHLFGADLRSGRVVLVANQEAKGHKDENPLALAVLKEAPKPKFPVRANFEGKIELLGYDLELPGGDHVGAGDHFEITWYFRALRSVPGDHKIFVHIDGDGQRIHGDHVPVEERYPVRYWDEGDVIVDRQKLEVPGTFRPATFTIFMGFFVGETRLEVTEGEKDDANRVRAGVLRIR